jgi:hypothetical protein
VDSAAGPRVDGALVQFGAKRLHLSRASGVGPWHHCGDGAPPRVYADQAVPVRGDDDGIHARPHTGERDVDCL